MPYVATWIGCLSTNDWSVLVAAEHTLNPSTNQIIIQIMW